MLMTYSAFGSRRKKNTNLRIVVFCTKEQVHKLMSLSFNFLSASTLLLALCSCFCARTTLAFDTSELTFDPLLASPFEARVGYVYQASDDNMRLDIGHSLDLLSLYSDSSQMLVLGADMMTWTRLRSSGKFKFPVETTDFYFGFNTSWLQHIPQGDLQVRFRLAHISSHIVDGYEGETVPFTFSREFIEVHGSFTPTDWNTRLYIGANVLFSTIPDGFNVLTPQVGIEHVYQVSEQVHLVAGYDMRLASSLTETVGTHAAMLGVDIGTLNQPHIRLQGLWYRGLSFHGMFYNEIDEYAGFAAYFIF